jgi:hypothetical protein
MDMVLRFLEMAVQLRHLAVIEKDPALRAKLETQADAYQTMARERAKALHLPMPDVPGGPDPKSGDANPT